MSDNEIEEVYQQFVLPHYTDEYKFRYVPLPIEKNNTPWRWENKDFPRVISLLEFERFVKEKKITYTKALAIDSLNDPEWYYIYPKKSNKKFKSHLSNLRSLHSITTRHCSHRKNAELTVARSIFDADYEKDAERYDLHTLDLPDKNFDFVMVNQTLEHVYDPIRCLKNIYKHMRPGGIIYFNVPSNSIPHNTPFHYYTGFTPTGIGIIAKLAGFKILSIGCWGSKEYMLQMNMTCSWPDYTQLENPGFNEVNYPVITWLFAVKPEKS